MDIDIINSRITADTLQTIKDIKATKDREIITIIIDRYNSRLGGFVAAIDLTKPDISLQVANHAFNCKGKVLGILCDIDRHIY